MENPGPIRAPNRREFERRYGVQRFYYESVLQELELRVKGSIENSGIRPVMKYRVKSFESYFQKYLKLLEQDAAPDAAEIHDMIGVRVICPFIEDVKRVEQVLQVCFDVKEIERKGAEHSFKEFGYESVHMLVRIPKDLKERYGGLDIDICEIQVRTILQEAWAEVEHELVYKARFDPKDDPMKRKLAAINAILSLSDLIFQDIREYQRRFMDEISVRRGSFYDKVEREIDRELFGAGEEPRLARGEGEKAVEADEDLGIFSIDDLLLRGLNAHNQADFPLAVSIYSEILRRNPEASVRSLVHKHRGMAHFAQSMYEDAIGDFSNSLTIDEGDYKAAYYRGVVRCVRQEYVEAISDFDRSISVHPYNFFCLFRRSQAYYHQGDFPKALADCEAALCLEPEDSNANRLKGMVLEKLRM